MRRRTESCNLTEPTATMCDACGAKLRILSRKILCQYCSNQFCHNCVSKSGSPTRPVNVCKACYLERLGLIDRSQLLPLTTLELKYFAKRRQIEMSLNVRHEELVSLILTWQAKDLAQKTKLALREALGQSREEVDLGDLNRLLEDSPYVSTYSMSGGGAGLASTILEEREFGDWQYVVTGSGMTRGSTEAGNGVGRTLESEGGMAGGRRGSLDGIPATDVRYSMSKEKYKSDNPEVDLSQVTSLDGLTSVQQVLGLSVKQLKLILQQNCINYKGCVEKEELQVRVRRLWQAKEEERIKVAQLAQAGDAEAESSYLCKICMDAPVDCVLLECGHMLTCVKCGRQLAECPICRQYVSRVVHAFRV